MSKPNRPWQAVLAVFGTPAKPRHSAPEPFWLGASGWALLHAWLPAKAAVIVASDKLAPLEWWLAARAVPRDVGLLYAPYIADPRVVQATARTLPARTPVVYVSDLDPPSIVKYVELRRVAPFRSRLRFGGIDSNWLEAIRAMLPRVRIPLEAEEQRLLSRLEAALSLEGLVGSAALALLRSGFKVELEGACNPRLYPASHNQWVFSALRRAADGSQL